MTFGPQSTTSDVTRGLDLTGSTVVVTGGSGGLGFETARSLVGAGAAVVLLDKDAARGEASTRRLRDEQPGADVTSHIVDLTDHHGIRGTAAALLAQRPSIDVLINNAGAVFGTRTLTSFGWEATLATNFLGHFVLTGQLLPAVRGRVVNLGSGAHRGSPIIWDDPHFAHRRYTPRDAYAQSKSAVALFTYGLEERLAGTGVHVYTVRPGVVATGLYGDLSEAQQAAFSSRVAGGAAGMSVEQAAATTVWAATAREPGDGGAYLAACAVVGTPSAPSADGGHAPWIFDRSEADRLWHLAERTVGEQRKAG
ncbi:MAG TPA: SDR family NAD(P)-dependent oxidoreductase [Pseudonocardiaceae bacterium]|jgi:NAD(P)-dependent dehydrogenase (short-subunit alcohol dehydrogenase family)|nr:SDR family NAD(P)-dependent oxidoreductase [Pseudonocardiaceae bacterium]